MRSNNLAMSFPINGATMNILLLASGMRRGIRLLAVSGFCKAPANPRPISISSAPKSCHRFVSTLRHFSQNHSMKNTCQAKKTRFFHFIGLGIVLVGRLPLREQDATDGHEAPGRTIWHLPPEPVSGQHAAAAVTHRCSPVCTASGQWSGETSV